MHSLCFGHVASPLMLGEKQSAYPAWRSKTQSASAIDGAVAAPSCGNSKVQVAPDCSRVAVTLPPETASLKTSPSHGKPVYDQGPSGRCGKSFFHWASLKS